MKRHILALFFLLCSNGLFAREAFSCNSYNAIYKPPVSTKVHHQYEMTISQVIPDNMVTKAYEILEFNHFDEEGLIYKLKLYLHCSSSGAQYCLISEGDEKAIKLAPSAIDADFSSRSFIERDKEKQAPYALILGNSSHQFYYYGPHISDKNITFYREQKPFLNSFPPVWIFDRCK